MKLIGDLLHVFDSPADVLKTDAETMAKRDTHAKKVEEAARVYMSALQNFIPTDRVPLYVHMCVDHAPDMIRKVGSLSRWSMQGEEHLHSLRKKDRGRRCSFAKEGTKRRGGGLVRRSMYMTQVAVEFIRAKCGMNAPEREMPWVRRKAARLKQLVGRNQTS